MQCVAGDFNCDGYDDLAVGIPQENISTSDANGGAVNVIYGSSGGLTALNDWFHQDTTDVTGSVQSSDNFGASLLAANFTGDFSGGNACDDLIVGVPGEDIGYADVGAMQLFPGDPSDSTSRRMFGFDRRTKAQKGAEKRTTSSRPGCTAPAPRPTGLPTPPSESPATPANPRGWRCRSSTGPPAA